MIIAVISNGYSLSLSYKKIFWQENKSIKEQFKDCILIATKTSLILDLVGTLSAMTGILALLSYMFTGNQRFDAIGAILIGTLILVFSRGLIFSVRDLLIGLSITDSHKEIIKAAVLRHKEVLEVLDVKGTIIGPEKLFVNLEVRIRDGLMTSGIELLMDRIKREVQEALPDVAYVQIELENP